MNDLCSGRVSTVVRLYLVEVVEKQRAVPEPVQEAPAAGPPKHVAGVSVQALAVHPHLRRGSHSTELAAVASPRASERN